ncbi:MAG: hypothetical protein H7258_05295 [Ferruginibacter sp.]|nr:hypothetical protein [Ferruginibacter sp.]
MRKVIPAILPLKRKNAFNIITRLKINENLLWELVKFKKGLSEYDKPIKK